MSTSANPFFFPKPPGFPGQGKLADAILAWARKNQVPVLPDQNLVQALS